MSAPKFMQCTACRDLFASTDSEGGFERWGNGERVRLFNNPASWGPDHARVSLFGFSKGRTQNTAISEAKRGQLPLAKVPFKGMGKRLGWLLEALGLRRLPFDVDGIFTDGEAEIRSGSLIRCSISTRVDTGEYSYKLADILAADGPSGGKVREVLGRCIRRHAAPSSKDHLFILLGLDDALIEWSRDVFHTEFGPVAKITPTTYRSGDASWVHVAHPAGNQTDPQYEKWCRGEGKKPKVLWAREEAAFRLVDRK